MSFVGGPNWDENRDSSFRTQYGDSRGYHTHKRGGYNGQKRANGNTAPNYRSEPYNRSPNQSHQKSGHRSHRHKHNGDKGPNAYIKSSFLENPWRHLEPRADSLSSGDETAGSSPTTSTPTATDSNAMQSTEELTSPTTAPRTALQLPPVQQTTQSSTSKLSGFLSLLPPPKQTESGPTELHLEAQ